MYFRDAGKGNTPYPYTVAAINNFRTLFGFDAVTFQAMTTLVVDKKKWGYGNFLNFKTMLSHLKNGALPETFGATWHSPIYASPMEFHAELAWKVYRRSGDKKFLEEAYSIYKAVYEDKDLKPGEDESGREVMAVGVLEQMAAELGNTEDAEKWRKLKEARLTGIASNWEIDTPNYFGSGKTKDVWNLAPFYSPYFPAEYVEKMTEHWVMNSESGFLSEVPLRIRAADSEQIPPFNANTINTYLAIEGMFRHNVDDPAIELTLAHFNGLVRDYGFPITPECWDENNKPWGSAYYGWDEIIALLPVERLAGVDFSLLDDGFTVSEHLPESWAFAEVYMPVVKNGKTHWTHVKTTRQIENGNTKKTISVKGNTLANLSIEPRLEGKSLVSASPEGFQDNQPKGHIRYNFRNTENASVAVILEDQ